MCVCIVRMCVSTDIQISVPVVTDELYVVDGFEPSENDRLMVFFSSLMRNEGEGAKEARVSFVLFHIEQ